MLTLLQMMRTKEGWDTYSPLVTKNILSIESVQIMKDMEAWWKISSSDIDWKEFSTFFKVKLHPMWDRGKLELYDKIFDKLHTFVPVTEEVRVLKRTLLERDYANRIATLALRITEGSGDTIQDVASVVEEYNTKAGVKVDVDEMIITDDFEHISHKTTALGGYRWRLGELNKALGPLTAGKLVVVVARPDTGKSGFMISEATHLLTQLPVDKNLLWFNNEEEGHGVKKRIICGLLGITGEEFDKDFLSVRRKVEALIHDTKRIKVVDSASLDVFTISKMCRLHNPGIIVVDQLWKVRGFEKSANDATRITMLYNAAREWAKEYCPVIVASQAGGEASGEKWIGMESLYGSKTGAQGEADAIITIGRSYDSSVEWDARFLSVVKNKFPSPEDPTLRNIKCEVKIIPDIPRYVGYL